MAGQDGRRQLQLVELVYRQVLGAAQHRVEARKHVPVRREHDVIRAEGHKLHADLGPTWHGVPLADGLGVDGRDTGLHEGAGAGEPRRTGDWTSGGR